jgi:hypothetical protein
MRTGADFVTPDENLSSRATKSPLSGAFVTRDVLGAPRARLSPLAAAAATTPPPRR